MYQINLNNLYFRNQQSQCLPLLINDKIDYDRSDNIKDHVEAGDYFASLATVIDLTGQKIAAKDQASGERLQEIKKDLLHLQEDYRIVEK